MKILQKHERKIDKDSKKTEDSYLWFLNYLVTSDGYQIIKHQQICLDVKTAENAEYIANLIVSKIGDK